jgi:nucleoside-diphosphate-sugar epimerase
MENRDKTILITGSSGFIGKNITQYLSQKNTLLTPSHKELDLLSQTEVHQFFLKNEIDLVVHCANIGGTRKTPVNNMIEKNTRMFFNLAENRDHFAKLIHLGSGAEYNKNRNLQNIRETEFGKEIPSDEYGFSKYIISKYIEKSEDMYCLRLFGIFGKYEDYEFKFISNAIVKNLLHIPITIRQNVRFSWLYIDDFLDILDYFLSHDPLYATYNVTPSSPIDLVSIAQLINSQSDFESDICVENEGLNFEYSGNNARLIDDNGNFSFTPMKCCIRNLIDYYSSILPSINPEIIHKDPFAAYCKIIPNAKGGSNR